jgi:hypothetical protein
MNNKITIVGLGRNNPNQLFAIGDWRKEFYFIAPPTDATARTYFDDVYRRVKAGERVEVEASLYGRNAQLIIPSNLEPIVQTTGTMVAPPQNGGFSTAQILATDLYSSIHDAKEAQFAIHGKHCQFHYDEKMEALMQGKPQQRLQDDILARDVVRLLLTTRKPTHLQGRNNKGWWSDVEFPNVEDRVLRNRIHALMNEDGLLDSVFQCHEPDYYAFESEFIVQPWDRNPSYLQSEFVTNETLRIALAKMLKPFEAEKPQFVL